MILDLTDTEFLDSGHFSCSGCGEALALRYILKVLGGDTIMVLPACLGSVLDGIWPYTAIRIPVLHCTFETTASAAAGIRAALDIEGNYDTQVLAWAGGSGAFAAGIGAVSSAAERNDDIIYVSYDNETYLNIFQQQSQKPANNDSRLTHTTARRRKSSKKSIMEIMAAHGIPYCATACIAYPDDLVRKVRKAMSIKGFRFFDLISPCPSGWKIPSAMSIELTRMAVQTCIFPIYEIENGEIYTINIVPETTLPINKYFSRQGRFSHLIAGDVRLMQRRVDDEWKRLLQKAESSRSSLHGHAKSREEQNLIRD